VLNRRQVQANARRCDMWRSRGRSRRCRNKGAASSTLRAMNGRQFFAVRNRNMRNVGGANWHASRRATFCWGAAARAVALTYAQNVRRQPTGKNVALCARRAAQRVRPGSSERREQRPACTNRVCRASQIRSVITQQRASVNP